jgi:3-hydroxybutyryl-CoA dehydratase
MNTAPSEKRYADIALNEQASFAVTVTEALVNEFSKVSGDASPLHMDDAYASTTQFGRRVAHGMIAGALFSRLVGMHLPGKYAVYLSQTLRFHEPVFIGDEITVTGVVTHKTDAAKTITIKTTVENARSKKLLVSGEAMVSVLQ